MARILLFTWYLIIWEVCKAVFIKKFGILLHKATSILSGNTLDNHLNHAFFSLSDKLKGFLGLFKLESVGDEPLNVDFSGSDQVHGGRITPSGITN